MRNNIEEKLNNFISLVNDKYPQLFVSYEKESSSNIYKIWHNDDDLEYHDKEFRIFTGKLLTEMFLDDNIFNVYMTFDYDNAMEINSSNFSFENSCNELEPVEIKHVIFGDDCNNSSKISFNFANVDDNYVSDKAHELKSKGINAKVESAAEDNFAIAA